MTYAEWITAGVVTLCLVLIVTIAYTTQPAHSETRIGPETQISMADLCPEGIN